MSQASLNPVSDIVKQLVKVFQAQKVYVSSEQAFVDMQPWEQMIMEWNGWNEKLQISLQHTKLSDSDRISLNQLVDDHHKLTHNVEAELLKLGQQIHLLQNTKKARKTYEHAFGESIFYDEKK
jgi:hypothetical protein